MEGLQKKLKFFLRLGLFLFIFLALPAGAQDGASLFLAPASGLYNVGSTFSVTVKVNSGGVPINAAEGTVIFNTNELAVVSLSKSGSVFNLWVQEPDFSNALGTINFGGIVFNPGYTGTSGKLLTINFKAKAVGNASVSFSSGAVLANDGSGTNILSTLNNGLYTLKSSSTTPLPLAPAPVQILLPQVTSLTHPDQTKWYSNNNPEFSWPLPEGVTAVSYLINPKPDANPGTMPDGLKSSIKFTGVRDGIQYFHIRFKRGGTWGPIAHFKFQTDTQPPKSFIIGRVDTDASNVQPELLFETEDGLSGIDHYEMRMGGGNWFTVNKDLAGRPYKLPPQDSGTYKIEIKAFDMAGNGVSSSILINIRPRIISIRLALLLEFILKIIIKIYDYLINIISRGALFIGFLVVVAALIFYLIKTAGRGVKKLWKMVKDFKIKAAEKKKLIISERKSVKTFKHLVKDMEDELAFLKSIDKRRQLGPEEKYLKAKIEQYLKSLKIFKLD